MATKIISRESVNNMLNLAGDAWYWCVRGVKNFVEGIYIALAVVAVLIFFYNPIIFIPYSLLAPKGAAGILYADIPVLAELMQTFYRPWVALLPMRWKRHFMAKRGLVFYSAKQQVKYYRYNSAEGDDNKIKILKSLSREACTQIWQMDKTKDCVLLVQSGFALNDEQFLFLLNYAENKFGKCWDISLVQTCLAKNTPSDTQKLELLKTFEKTGDKDFLTLFFDCIKKYGASAELVNRVFEEHPHATAELKSALREYSERQIALYGKTEVWSQFLIEKAQKTITVSAQKAMAVWQYKAFHAAGFKLSEEAINYFLSKADREMCRLIMAYEPAEAFNEIAQTLITANPELRKMQLLTKKAVSL